MKKRFFNYCGDAFTTGCDIKTLIGYFMVVYMIKPWVMVLYASMLGLAFFTPRLGALLFLTTIVSLLLQAYGDAYEHLKKSAKSSNYLLERNTVFKRTKMFAILQKSITSLAGLGTSHWAVICAWFNAFCKPDKQTPGIFFSASITNADSIPVF